MVKNVKNGIFRKSYEDWVGIFIKKCHFDRVRFDDQKVVVLDKSVFRLSDCIGKKPGEPSSACQRHLIRGPWTGAVVGGTRVVGYGGSVDQWVVPVVWVRDVPWPSP